jgi:hypothetical protein
MAFGEGATKDPEIIHPPAQRRRDTTSHHHHHLRLPALLRQTRPHCYPLEGLAPPPCHSDSHVIHAPAPDIRSTAAGAPAAPSSTNEHLSHATPIAHSTPAGRRTGLLPYLSYYHGNSNRACGVPAQVYPAIDCAPTPWRSRDDSKPTTTECAERDELG